MTKTELETQIALIEILMVYGRSISESEKEDIRHKLSFQCPDFNEIKFIESFIGKTLSEDENGVDKYPYSDLREALIVAFESKQ